jgi:hypothetical protein
MMPEFLPGMNIRDVQFDHRQRGGLDGVANRIE